MTTKNLIIKVENDRILFNSASSITRQQTNIPDSSSMRFRSHKDIYWEVEMLKYDHENKVLYVKILNYDLSDISKFSEQEQKEEIERIEFIGHFHWKRLEPLLGSYTKSRFKAQLYEEDTTPPIPRSGLNNRPPNSSSSVISKTNFFHYLGPAEKTINVNFRVGFKDVTFINEFVQFNKLIKEVAQAIDFQISNAYVRIEFEHIKPWFPKILKTKTINVEAAITYLGSEIKSIIARSPEIDRITPEVISKIKYQRTNEITKKRKDSISKELYTKEEILPESVGSSPLAQTDQDILALLSGEKNIRNKKELAYLSKELQSTTHPIRYTLYPNFGFLFLVQGAERNHFVWELLESHATYIWSISRSDKGIATQYARLESILSWIRDNGRESYKQDYKDKKRDQDIVFLPVSHNVTDNTQIEFLEWKEKIDQHLV